MPENLERKRRLEAELIKIVAKLKQDYAPRKIILFGSLATGTVGEWSDIDLAIIKDTKLRFLDRLTEVALLCRAKVGVDFLVYTPEEFEQAQRRRNYFILDEIIERGKVLYENRQNP